VAGIISLAARETEIKIDLACAPPKTPLLTRLKAAVASAKGSAGSIPRASVEIGAGCWVLDILPLAFCFLPFDFLELET
jgi:hypothetical protein